MREVKNEEVQEPDRKREETERKRKKRSENVFV